MMSMVFRVLTAVICVFAVVQAIKPKERKMESKRSNDDSDLEVVFLNVLSTIQSRFATTAVTSLVTNTGGSAKEITFTAQLPDAAFISNFSMQIDDKVIYGLVKEKEQAKADFDAAKARGESTGLVSKKPRETNAFAISVNVAAHSKIRFNLTYQEILKRVHGVYKHVVNLQPDKPVSDLKVDVYITERGEIENVKIPKFGEKTGEKTNKDLIRLQDEPDAEINPIIKENGANSIHIHYKPKSRSSSSNNGQLVVLYDVKRDKTAGDIEVVNGYFVHFFAPEGLPKRPKDIVFVLDKSGSMEGRKMTQLKDAMKVILKDLDTNDRFHIIFFSDEPESWRKEFSKASSDNVRAAVDHVGDTLADGGTNIDDSLKEAVKFLKKTSSASTNVPMILFLTDGQPTVGETSATRIVDDTTEANDAERKILIHGVAFGDDADYHLLQRLSSRNKGLARRVYEDSDSSLQLEGFYDEISSPVLTNVKIDYLNETVDTSSLVDDSTTNYYDGSEMVVIGKIRDKRSISSSHSGEFSAKVRGQGAGGAPVDLMCRSSPVVYCPRPIPWNYYDYDIIEPQPRLIDYYRPPIWCCPPPHCCWHSRCYHPPPTITTTQAPKELLPSSSVGGFVERMWAYQSIKKLLRETDLKDGQDKETAKRRALDLSLKYHFVTELTSMVVVKPDEAKPIPLEEDRFVPCASCNAVAFGGGAVSKGGNRAPSPSGTAVDQSSSEASRPMGGGLTGGQLAGAGGPTVGGKPHRPPPPPPPPPKSTSNGKKEPEGGETDDRDKQRQKSTAAPSSAACKMDIVFVKDNASVSSTIESRRKAYIVAALNHLKTNSSISAKGAVVDTYPNGQGSVVFNLDQLSKLLDYFNGQSSSKRAAPFKSGLTQILNGQINQDDTSASVKRYAVFLITTSSMQFAVDASTQLRSNGVVVFAVSFVDDKSSGFAKRLNSIAQDPARVFTVPSSTGKDLGQALARCR